MTKPISVSVIIPAYNEEKLIERTLKNIKKVLPQSQIIVSDGGSKDSTVRIAKKYAKVVFEKLHSVGGGRNAGAQVATSDILLFVDADTFPTKSFVDSMFKEFSDENVVCVSCSIMPENLDLFSNLFFRFLNLIVIFNYLIGKPTIAGSCVAYRKSAFKKAKGFDPYTMSAEDFDLSLRITEFGKVRFLTDLSVPTSNRRYKKLGLIGLCKDWTKTSINFILGRKTSSYYAPR